MKFKLLILLFAISASYCATKTEAFKNAYATFFGEQAPSRWDKNESCCSCCN